MREKMPFFSVIVLAYRVGPYLSECLDSILNQTFQDYEIILVNPPSDDQTDNICEIYQKRDKRINVIKCDNQGQLINRLMGYSIAKGDYLLCVDGDDWWKPITLETIYTAIQSISCDWIIFGYEKIKNGRNIGSELHIFQNMALFEGEDKKKIYEKLIQGEKLNSAWTKVMSRELFLKTNHNYEEFSSVRKGEDLLYCLYVADAAEKILYLDVALYCYRQRSDSVVRTFSLREITDRTIIAKQIEIMMRKWHMDTIDYYNILCRSMEIFFIQEIFRCSTSSASYKEKMAVFAQIRDSSFYRKNIPFNNTLNISFKYRIFLFLFCINFALLYICGNVYRLGRKIKGKYMKRG